MAICGNWNMCTKHWTHVSAYMRCSEDEFNKIVEFVFSLECQIAKISVLISQFPERVFIESYSGKCYWTL
jgi:hypothetical protein